MAEALATLGVAANVLQLVECSCRIITTAYELKESGDGAINSNRELDKLAQNLRDTMASIRASPVAATAPELMESVSTCVDLSNDLSKLLESLRLDPKDSTSSLKRLGASVRSFRKASEIKRLDDRLVRLQRQVCDQFNVTLL